MKQDGARETGALEVGAHSAVMNGGPIEATWHPIPLAATEGHSAVMNGGPIEAATITRQLRLTAAAATPP